MITTGLLDLQVNGFAGIDFNDDALTPDALDHALEAMLGTGVTGCLPTLITADAATLAARFHALDAAVAGSRLGPLMVPGYHLEGPFLNPAEGYAGCHPPAVMVAPDAVLVDRLAGSLRRPILLVTIAPELPGSDAFIREQAARGRVVALGHSAADVAAVARATDAGATMSTHLGNGIAQHHHKFANPLFAQLSEDGLHATFIADGIHIPPAALKVLLRTKSIGRSILVTDAVAAAAAPPGTYPFAGMVVERGSDGTVRLPGSPYLAGSSLTLDAAVRNVVAWELCSVDEAVAMAGAHPRAAMAGAMRHHGIAMPAGRVTWDDGLRVVSAEIDGRSYPVRG